MTIQGFSKEATPNAGTESNDLFLGDEGGETCPEITAQPNIDSTAGGGRKQDYTGALIAFKFAARLDRLRVDQSPDDLSLTLQAALQERALYDLYLSFLVGDITREKALLEVFDKVRSGTCATS